MYLCVSALVPYKRIDLAVEACNRLRRRLVVIGSGPQRRRLAKLAGPTVELAGWRSVGGAGLRQAGGGLRSGRGDRDGAAGR